MRSAILLCALGCRERTSEDIPTADLYFEISAYDAEDGLLTAHDMRLRLDVHDIEGPVLFQGGDVLSVLADGVLVDLEQIDGGYVGVLGSFGGTLDIHLARDSDGDLSLSVPVAPAYTITGATDEEGLELSWDQAQGDHALTLMLSGACINPFGRNLAIDTGFYTISRAEIQSYGDCDLLVELTARVYSTSAGHVSSSERTSAAAIPWTL